MSQDVFKGAKHQHQLGDRVTKMSGSSWTGQVVGFYSTELTPVGYAVESETEKGSVQIYPEKALRAAPIQAAQDTIKAEDRPDQGAPAPAPTPAQSAQAATKSFYGAIKTDNAKRAAAAAHNAPPAPSPAPAAASFDKPSGGSPFSRFKK